MRFPRARAWLAGVLAATAMWLHPVEPVEAAAVRAQVRLVANLRVEEHDAETGVLLRAQEKRNLVVDAGLNLIRDLLDGDAVAGLTHMAVGTGSTAAAAAQTALVAEVARGAVTQRISNAKQLIVRYFLPSTLGNGSTLAEVGILNAASTGTMFARAVLASTIAKTSSITVLFVWTINLAAA